MTATRNVNKSLASVEDLAVGIGTVTQERGVVHKVDVSQSSLSVQDLRNSTESTFRLYASPKHYTDFVRIVPGLTGVPGIEGMWQPKNASTLTMVGNDTKGAFIFDGTCAIYSSVTDSLYSFTGPYPFDMPEGYDIQADSRFKLVPAAAMFDNYVVWVDDSGALRTSTALPSDTSAPQPEVLGIAGQYKNLAITVPNIGYTGSVSASKLLVGNTAGICRLLTSISVSFNGAVVGVNGLDSGSIAAGNWYYVYVILDPATNSIGSLLSLSSVLPVLPAGYTMFALVGVVRVLPATTAFVKSVQKNNYVFYGTATAAEAIQILTSGTATTSTTVSTASAVPPIAERIKLTISGNTNGNTTISDALGLQQISNFGGSFYPYNLDIAAHDVQQIKYKVNNAAYPTNIFVIGYFL